MKRLNNKSKILVNQYYSIKNLMLCPAVIASVIRDHFCDTDYDITEVEAWLCHFDEKVHILMMADYLVELNHLGLKCMGDNCSRFLVSQHLPDFDNLKIESYIQGLAYLTKS